MAMHLCTALGGTLHSVLRVPIKRAVHNVNVSLVGLLLSQAESTITKEVPKLKVSLFL